jgi:hypothetical protein
MVKPRNAPTNIASLPTLRPYQHCVPTNITSLPTLRPYQHYVPTNITSLRDEEWVAWAIRFLPTLRPYGTTRAIKIIDRLLYFRSVGTQCW